MLVGKVAAHVWFGDYSALYIELGELSAGRVRRDGSIGNSVGEITVYGAFGWSVASQQGSITSTALSETQRQQLASRILGTHVVSAELTNVGPELQIKFSSGELLVTRSMDVQEPEWSVSFNAEKLGHLCIKDGALYVERRNP